VVNYTILVFEETVVFCIFIWSHRLCTAF